MKRQYIDDLTRKILFELFSACLSAQYVSVENDASFALETDGKRLYIFFEHSNGTTDWINNLSFNYTEGGTGDLRFNCHEGFLRVWQSVIPYVSDAILNPAFREIVIVGYSHGAALAVLCHEYVMNVRQDIKDGIFGFGFGCPRVIRGRLAGAPALWHNFFVVRNIDDLVTHLPPTILGYKHVGTLIEIGKAEKYSSIDAHRQESYLSELSPL